MAPARRGSAASCPATLNGEGPSQVQHRQLQQSAAQPLHVNVVRRMQVKVLYSFDDSSNRNCLARCRQPLNIQTAVVENGLQIGIVELRTCIEAIVAGSPELISQLGNDYTVYAYDYSEYEAPMVGQGMLSRVLAASSSTPLAPAVESLTMVTGKVTRNCLALFSGGIPETLEVKLRLVPVPTALENQYLAGMEQYRGNGTSDLNAAAWGDFVRNNPGFSGGGASSISSSPGLPMLQDQFDSGFASGALDECMTTDMMDWPATMPCEPDPTLINPIDGHRRILPKPASVLPQPTTPLPSASEHRTAVAAAETALASSKEVAPSSPKRAPPSSPKRVAPSSPKRLAPSTFKRVAPSTSKIVAPSSPALRSSAPPMADDDDDDDSDSTGQDGFENELLRLMADDQFTGSESDSPSISTRTENRAKAPNTRPTNTFVLQNPLTQPPKLCRSGSSNRKKENIQSKLESDIAAGKMPDYCHNCGDIKTPAWRIIYMKECQGAPDPAKPAIDLEEKVAHEPLTHDEAGKITSYRILKKKLARSDKDFDRVRLCNQCGCWFINHVQMRPKGAGTKPANPESRAEKARNRRAKSKQSNVGSNTESSAGPSSSAAADFVLDLDPETGRDATTQGGLDANAAQEALQKAILASPPKFPRASPIDLEAPVRRSLSEEFSPLSRSLFGSPVADAPTAPLEAASPLSRKRKVSQIAVDGDAPVESPSKKMKEAAMGDMAGDILPSTENKENVPALFADQVNDPSTDMVLGWEFDTDPMGFCMPLPDWTP